jgi:hypothetical protein
MQGLRGSVGGERRTDGLDTECREGVISDEKQQLSDQISQPVDDWRCGEE